MQHALDLVRPYWPLILALIVWPLVGAALSWWLWWDTPEHWDAYAKAHPGRAFIVRAIRTVSPHLRKLVVAWREYAAARSSLPPLGIALPAEKQGALDVSATRPEPPHPTPPDGVAHDAQRRTLGAVTVDPRKSEPPFDPHARQTVVPEVVAEVQRAAGSAHPAQIFAPAFFDPTARQTIAPEVTAQIADEALPRDPSQRGSVSLRALLAVVVGLSVVLPVGVALSGCPRLPEVSGCQPEAQTCIGDRPHVCSASQRWHRAGDLSCGAVGGVCTVLGGRAYCAPSADAGVGGDL